MIEYSELKNKINIEPLKDSENEQAFVVQYFHNLENGVGFAVTTRVGHSVIPLIPQLKRFGIAVASSNCLLTTHIPNATKQRLPLQSLTQVAA